MLSDVITSTRDLMISPLESLLVIENRDVQGQLRVDLIRGSEVFSDPIAGARGLGNNDRITLVPIQPQSDTDSSEIGDPKDDADSDRQPLVSGTGENPETAAFGDKTRFDRGQFFEELNQRVIASSALTQVPPLVDVSGVVNQVGTYPLSTRATVGDLILAAGGFGPDADIKSVELVKRTPSGFEIIAVGADQFNQTGLVTAGSELIVRQDQDKTSLPAVQIKGFVRYPGVYRMPRGSTIGQLLQRAGGTLPNADLRAAVFSRRSIKEREIAQLRRLQKDTASELAANDVNALEADVGSTK
jgi:protein involved in polysaccharide export with SLBB domain